LKKFAMMQKMNLPQGAIEQAMVRANVDPALLFGASAMTSMASASPAAAIAEGGGGGPGGPLEKYYKMQKMNLPQGAIEQKMIADGIDPSAMFGESAMTHISTEPRKLVISASKRTDPTASPGEGGNFLDELRQGPALRKVESPGTKQVTASSSGSELMQGILAGRGNLRKVEKPVEEAKKATPSLDGGGVASILARRIAIIGEQGSDTDSAGSEWEDDDDM